MNEIAAPRERTETPTPSVYTDRAALSEAWFRALYGAPKSARRASAPAAPGMQPKSTSGAAQPRNAQTPFASTSARVAAPSAVSAQRQFGGAIAYRSRAARTVDSLPPAPPWREALARRLTFRLALADGGSVDLLVQQRGRRVHILALSDDDTAPRTAAALRRAHHALLLQGVRVALDSRRKGLS